MQRAIIKPKTNEGEEQMRTASELDHSLNLAKGETQMKNTRRQKATEVAKTRYYELPKWLMHEKAFKGLSMEAKVLYAMLNDRNTLSIKNNWVDDNGDIYMIYTRKNMMEDLDLSEKTVTKAMKDLNKYGLVDEVRQGCNKPNLLYLCTVDLGTQWNRKSYGSGTVTFTYPDKEILRPNELNINELDVSEPLNSLVPRRENETTPPEISNENIEYIQDKTTLKLTPAQCREVSKWTKDKIETAINLFIVCGGHYYSFLRKCYYTPFDAVANPKKKNTFSESMYKHDWDLEELEKQAMNYMASTLNTPSENRIPTLE